jgi:hypothetical protein
MQKIAFLWMVAVLSDGLNFTLDDNECEKQLIDECLLGLFDLGHLVQSGLYYVIHERKVPASIEV